MDSLVEGKVLTNHPRQPSTLSSLRLKEVPELLHQVPPLARDA